MDVRFFRYAREQTNKQTNIQTDGPADGSTHPLRGGEVTNEVCVPASLLYWRRSRETNISHAPTWLEVNSWRSVMVCAATKRLRRTMVTATVIL